MIEQVNGQLKNKFRCLLIGMSMEPRYACHIVTACCVLHNISKALKEPNLDADNDVDVPVEAVYPEDVPDEDGDIGGQAVRAQIIADFFAWNWNFEVLFI